MLKSPITPNRAITPVAVVQPLMEQQEKHPHSELSKLQPSLHSAFKPVKKSESTPDKESVTHPTEMQ